MPNFVEIFFCEFDKYAKIFQDLIVSYQCGDLNEHVFIKLVLSPRTMKCKKVVRIEWFSIIQNHRDDFRVEYGRRSDRDSNSYRLESFYIEISKNF